MRPRSPSELKQLLDAERAASPFLIWRDADGGQRLMELAGRSTLTVGRRGTNQVALTGDWEVSRLHARLELIDQDWTIADDGLSRNGTFVNGVRVLHRRRLSDGDTLRFGSTLVHYRAPTDAITAVTAAGDQQLRIDSLTDIQRRVLVALCRPYLDGSEHPMPATNPQIAAEVFLGVDAVKAHLRKLYRRFEIADLRQNQKRVQLAEQALSLGLVAEHDL